MLAVDQITNMHNEHNISKCAQNFENWHYFTELQYGYRRNYPKEYAYDLKVNDKFSMTRLNAPTNNRFVEKTNL